VDRADWVELLLDRYYAEAAEGGHLAAFVEQAAHGAFGPVPRAALADFLDRLEVILLGNIETKLEEGGDLRDLAEAAAAAVRAELTDARERLAAL
jgi:hypothetical protein